MTHRVAFYPCCSTDVAGPLELLRDFADEVVFCDVNPSLPRLWKDIAARIAEGSPKASFLSEDVRTAVDGIERIDVFFYRHDSDGEGGSGVFVLGNSFLPHSFDVFQPMVVTSSPMVPTAVGATSSE
jgi:hypothetical protein